MKLDGERIIREREEEKQRERERIFELNKRRQDWAARKIQAAAKVYKARQIMRQRAYAYYRKHWDPFNMAYFYEDKRSKETYWDKPRSLGSYDVQCAPGWVTMHDNEGDQYYYNPLTWAMSWTQPPRTTLCNVCQKQFAIVRVSNDLICRCENCFNEKAAELLETLTAEEILFKPFHGNREIDPIFAIMKEKSWAQYLREHDMNMDEAYETLEQEKKRMNEEAALGRMVVKKEKIVEYCADCKTELATWMCEICTEYFCKPCLDRKHTKAPWNLHAVTELAAMTFSGKEPGAGGPPQSPLRRRRRRRRKHRDPDRAASPGGGGEGGGGYSSGEGGGDTSASDNEGPPGSAQGKRRKKKRRHRRRRREAEEEAAAAAADGFQDYPPTDVSENAPTVTPPVPDGGTSTGTTGTGTTGTTGTGTATTTAAAADPAAAAAIAALESAEDDGLSGKVARLTVS
jgi:hypothetical protein